MIRLIVGQGHYEADCLLYNHIGWLPMHSLIETGSLVAFKLILSATQFQLS